MTACYGLGFVEHIVDAELSRDDALLALRMLARAAGVVLRDVARGIAVQVTPLGRVTELSGAEAEALVEAVAREGGSVPHSFLSRLDGYVVCVAAAKERTEVNLPDGRETYVGPLDDLVAHLDELLARDDIGDDEQDVHRHLRRIADIAARLRVPMIVGV